MNNYNFDELVERKNTNSYKWDEHDDPDIIPLWVADMDFKAAPCIINALQQRLDHGVFGYTFVPESYYEAVINWFSQRHGWEIQRSWMLYTTGVVPAISAVIKALTQPGDAVLVQSPVYNCFFSSIRNNQCHVVESPLKRVDTSDGFTYEVDWDDFEKQCADPRVKLFLLCNPHNPAGRVWTRDELQRMNDICLLHGVRVLADEIHCELVMPGYQYTPFASISQACLDNSITIQTRREAGSDSYHERSVIDICAGVYLCEYGIHHHFRLHDPDDPGFRIRHDGYDSSSETVSYLFFVLRSFCPYIFDLRAAETDRFGKSDRPAHRQRHRQIRHHYVETRVMKPERDPARKIAGAFYYYKHYPAFPARAGCPDPYRRILTEQI